MKGKWLVGVWALISAWAVAQPQVQDEIRDQAPQRYTVQQGDTLWGIAGRFLKDPWSWPAVWQANPQIANPHLIYPGNVILLCTIEGEKVLAVDPGGGCDRIAQQWRDSNGKDRTAVNGVVHLEPEVQDLGSSNVIPTISLRSILPYLNQSRVVDADSLKQAPYVISGGEGHLLAGAGDQAYVRGKMNKGQVYAVFRSAGEYIDPDTQEPLGEQADYVCNVDVVDTSTSHDINTVEVTRMRESLQINDRALPIQRRIVVPVYYPKAADKVKPGRVIRVLGGVMHAGQNDVIVINRGQREGMQPGHVVSLYRHGAVVEDRMTTELVRLPDEFEGVAMVFRIFNKTSYALVLKSVRPIKVGDDTKPPHSGDY